MERDITVALKSLKQKMDKMPEKNGKASRYKKELEELIELFTNLKIPPVFKERYEEMIKRGTELNQGDNYRNIKKIDNFLPACFSLYFDIKGELIPIINKMIYSFMLTGILFVVVSMIMSLILKSTLFILTSAIFIGPLIIGIRGLSKSSGRGVVIGQVLIEFSTMVGLVGAIFGVTAVIKFSGFVNALIKQMGLTATGSLQLIFGIIVIIFPVLSIALVVISRYYSKLYKKYKKIFA